MSNLTIDPAIEQKLIDLAIDHIKKVEANRDVKTEGDNFDYWNSYELSDGNFIDYNISEIDGGASNNPSKWEWGFEAYRTITSRWELHVGDGRDSPGSSVTRTSLAGYSHTTPVQSTDR